MALTEEKQLSRVSSPQKGSLPPPRSNRLSDAPPRPEGNASTRDSFFSFRALVSPEELSVVFQPIVDMQDGKLFAHEALVRCSRPELPEAENVCVRGPI